MADEHRKGAKRQTIKTRSGGGSKSSRVPHGKAPEKAEDKTTEVNDHAGE